MSICLKCGKPTPRPKYCSLSCANSMPRAKKVKEPKQCEECGKEFLWESKSQRFCSRSCSVTRNNRVYPKKTRASSEVCALEGCTSFVKAGSKSFCGSEHWALYRRQRRINQWLAGEIVVDGAAGIHEGGTLRNYLYEDQNNVCAIDGCNQTRSWNGTNLNFILDHIDGNSTDSRRTNVRLICPNCDFQLPTSKGRNRGNGRYMRRLRYVNGESR